MRLILTSPALAIPRYLPPLSVQSRWYSEPLKLISFTDNTFRRNKEGCPTLLGITQSYITRLMRLKTVPWILLGDVGPLPGLDDPDELVTAASGHLSPDAAADASSSPTPAEATQMKRKSSKKTDDPLAHLRYLRYLQHNQPRRSSVEQYGSGYQDYLQIPLQPLADNLESMTYEVFEKDPVKYDLYEQAIGAALRDWAESGKPTSNRDGKVVVAVAGAGRGPLVTRALRASESECVEIELWAVEKNPNAYVILQRHNQEDWQNQVTVVKSDMRSWKGPWRPGPVSQSHGDPMSSGKSSNEPNITAGGKSSLLPGSQTKHAPLDSPNGSYGRIDILISELLGSFADNELSPECLDGILHLLSPQGISIPRSYTAYLTPIAAPRLHADISARTSWDPTAPETPSVVWLHAVDYLSLSTSNTEAGSENLPHTSPTPAQPMTSSPSPTPNILPVWEFAHEPLPEQKGGENGNSHNERFAKLNFRTRSRGVCHGLGGYFESVLYPGIELSTNPNTMEAKSNAMMSWFPIYFPLKVDICSVPP